MSDTIESSLKETRVFPPSADFARRSRLGDIEEYRRMHKRSLEDPEGFWGEVAREFHWFEKPRDVLQWDPPNARWFDGGRTNLAYNCLDRHLDTPLRNKAAFIWEAESGEIEVITYHQLHRRVCRFSNLLRHLGVGPGDRVAIYMGMVPQIAVAMLACARIGAVHTVIFGGFAVEAVRDRVNDCGAKLVITCDGAYRRGKVVPLKSVVDEAISQCPTVEHVIVYRRTGQDVTMQYRRDHDWDEAVDAMEVESEAEALESEHPLFILYTSGTTGKPKGVVHTTAGYMVGVGLTTRYVFDVQDTDTFFCTADAGWVTGHSYVVYGPLLAGLTTLIYEGAPDYPDRGRFWNLCERHGVTIFYTAPTAIRAFMRWGDQWPAKHNLGRLRLLGTVGEPINPEAWTWYQEHIGNQQCPIVDTWWQTETGGIMIAPLPGAVPTKPGSATLPFFGIDAAVVHKDGSPCGPNEGGYLIIRKPWPSMLRTIHGDHERYLRQYWSEIGDDHSIYFTGDGARQDEDGYFWLMGRVDDVVNVSGHRLGTAEIESALVSHESVAEAAVVGRPDDVKGQALVAFVTLRPGFEAGAPLRSALTEHVGNEIGKFARPDRIRFADGLPKTRSGKIMRRLLKELASTGEARGDMTTLEDLSVLAALAQDKD